MTDSKTNNGLALVRKRISRAMISGNCARTSKKGDSSKMEANPVNTTKGKQVLMYFGCICQGCKQFVRLGKIDVEPSAPPSRLHELLHAKSWMQDEAICEEPLCGHRTFVTRDRTLLGKPVVTSPDGVET